MARVCKLLAAERSSALGEQRQAVSGTLTDEVAICGGPEADAEPEETPKGDARMASSVPEKDEFVEIALHMDLAQSVNAPLA